MTSRLWRPPTAARRVTATTTATTARRARRRRYRVATVQPADSAPAVAPPAFVLTDAAPRWEDAPASAADGGRVSGGGGGARVWRRHGGGEPFAAGEAEGAGAGRPAGARLVPDVPKPMQEALEARAAHVHNLRVPHAHTADPPTPRGNAGELAAHEHERERAFLQRVFAAFDRDGSGTITLSEVRKLFDDVSDAESLEGKEGCCVPICAARRPRRGGECRRQCASCKTSSIATPTAT